MYGKGLIVGVEVFFHIINKQIYLRTCVFNILKMLYFFLDLKNKQIYLRTCVFNILKMKYFFLAI
jgi:hypothetical protein